MKKNALIIVIMCSLIFLSTFLNVSNVQAQDSSYTIDSVDHNVRVLYSGHVVISEKIHLSGQIPESFLMGFPFRYGSYALKGVAYAEDGTILPVTLGVQLQDQSGFYGVSVNLSNNADFTVVMMFSNSLLTVTGSSATTSTTTYNLNFPAYPSFVTSASQVNANFTIPLFATSILVNKEDGNVNQTNTNSITYSKTNLQAFYHSPANATFSASQSELHKADIPSLERLININPNGAVTCMDTYRIINNSTNTMNAFILSVPTEASNIAGKSSTGRNLETSVYLTPLFREVNITLPIGINPGESTIIAAEYTLPNIQVEGSTFSVDLDILPYLNYYVQTASVTIKPPEGAHFISPELSSLGNKADLQRDAFQESYTQISEGASYVDKAVPSQNDQSIKYELSPLWISFRPTSWIWAIAVIGCIIGALWTRPKLKKKPEVHIKDETRPKTKATLTSEDIQTFVESYEEKNRIMTELRSLEARAQRGRIPRRRYKVLRKTSENRLNVLNKKISDLKLTLRNISGHYADIVRKLEAAEVDLQESELKIQTVETQHSTGEIPLDTYRKELGEYERQKEKAEARIEQILLGLRGEIR